MPTDRRNITMYTYIHDDKCTHLIVGFWRFSLLLCCQQQQQHLWQDDLFTSSIHLPIS